MTAEYRRQLDDLNNGCGEVQTLIRSLLMTYSRQDTADDIHEKLQEYEDRLDTMARLKQELDLKIAAWCCQACADYRLSERTYEALRSACKVRPACMAGGHQLRYGQS